jgi:hypothetical protein
VRAQNGRDEFVVVAERVEQVGCDGRTPPSFALDRPSVALELIEIIGPGRNGAKGPGVEEEIVQLVRRAHPQCRLGDHVGHQLIVEHGAGRGDEVLFADPPARWNGPGPPLLQWRVVEVGVGTPVENAVCEQARFSRVATVHA